MLPLRRFTFYIKQHALFNPKERILLAVSGGKDSVLMAHLFKQAGFHFSIAHCNFNLRGDESQRDEAFVHLLAADLDVPVFVKQFGTKEYAADHKLSAQMAARQLRYQWFHELLEQENFRCVATAHHQNDVVETVLINLIRGTGISGMHGILPRSGNLVRPLLFLTSAEIDTLVEENNISFVEDSSNSGTSYVRNKIRHHIIPHMREINPAIEKTFEQNVQRFAETEMVLQQSVEALRSTICAQLRDGLSISLEGIKRLNPQKLLIYELLYPFHFSAPVADEILSGLDKQSGTSYYSPTHRATIDRENLLITPLKQEENAVCIWHSNAGSLKFNDLNLKLTVSTQLPWQFNPAHAYIDFEKLIFPLIVRTWQPGDTFIPLGMEGFKKLSDFFIDSKIPLPAKQHIPILINGNSQLMWVGGLRQDERYKVTTATKKVAIFELES